MPEPILTEEQSSSTASIAETLQRSVITLESQHLCAIFGVTEPNVAERLLGQLLSVLHPDFDETADGPALHQALGLIRDIAPKGSAEAMLAVMMVACQHAAMETMRRGTHQAQTPGGRAMYIGLGLKAARAFTQLCETLNHGRGRGVTQRVVVEHINIEPGGQAVVGAVASRD